MFTGIVEEMGTVRRLNQSPNRCELELSAAKVLEGTQIGDSIAVNGVCLTVIRMDKDHFTADVMPETLRRSNLGQLKTGSKVNLERAMAADGRFGGHIVAGHIDGTGTIRSMQPEGNAVLVTISAAPELLRYVVEKGSIAIDGISLTVAVCGIKTIQQAHVTRNMKFQYFFYSAFAGAIVSTVLGLGLAYMGFGVWALVVQQVSNITVDTLVLWKLSSWRPKMEFSWQHLKGLLSYGWKLLASSLSSVIYNNLRSLIIGKMYTSADLAYYNQGDNLTYNIASSVDTSIESVLFPVMSSLQDDRAQVKNMTRRSIKTCTYIIAPVMMSTAFCAEPLVRLILTEKWLPCVLFLRVFCLGYVCWPIITANLNAAKAVGRSDLYLKCQLLNEGVCILLLLATFRVSVEAIAYGMLITNIVTQILDAQLNKKLIGYGYLEQMRDILPTLLLAAGAGLCMYLVIFLHLPDLLTVIIQVVVGLGIYLTGSAILELDTFEYFKDVLAPSIRQKLKR